MTLIVRDYEKHRFHR